MGLRAYEFSRLLDLDIKSCEGNDLLRTRETVYITQFRKDNSPVNGPNAWDTGDWRVQFKHIRFNLLIQQGSLLFNELQLFYHLSNLEGKGIRCNTDTHRS